MISLFICVLFVFLRVFYRSAALENGTNSGEAYLGSISGQPLEESFKTISRADEFAESTDGYLLIVTMPFFIAVTISDFIFVWNLVVQILIFFLESGKPTLFKFFTCNCWKSKDFREKYMSEANENGGDSLNEASLNTGLNKKVFPGNESDDEDVVAPEQILAEIDGESKRSKNEKPKKESTKNMAAALLLFNPPAHKKKRILTEISQIDNDKSIGEEQIGQRQSDDKSKDSRKDSRNTGMPPNSEGRDRVSDEERGAHEIVINESPAILGQKSILKDLP